MVDVLIAGGGNAALCAALTAREAGASVMLLEASTLLELARALGLPQEPFMCTLDAYNASCRPGTFDHATLGDCRTEGLSPPKTHLARPIDTPPFTGYSLRPGITLTYLGLKVDESAAVRCARRLPCRRVAQMVHRAAPTNPNLMKEE
jgi:hypothetical protein